MLKLKRQEEGKILIAKSLLKAGLTFNLISDSTGLTKEQIEKLK